MYSRRSMSHTRLPRPRTKHRFGSAFRLSETTPPGIHCELVATTPSDVCSGFEAAVVAKGFDLNIAPAPRGVMKVLSTKLAEHGVNMLFRPRSKHIHLD